jgi:hypothetical protein
MGDGVRPLARLLAGDVGAGFQDVEVEHRRAPSP